MDKGFSFLERLIYAANARHKVIASNIANADTPRFRAKDLDFRAVVEDEAAALVTTTPMHIKTSGVPGGVPSAMTDAASDPWGDGNNVELDMEMAKMTENALLYEAGARLLSSKMRMFRNALRR